VAFFQLCRVSGKKYLNRKNRLPQLIYLPSINLRVKHFTGQIFNWSTESLLPNSWEKTDRMWIWYPRTSEKITAKLWPKKSNLQYSSTRLFIIFFTPSAFCIKWKKVGNPHCPFCTKLTKQSVIYSYRVPVLVLSGLSLLNGISIFLKNPKPFQEWSHVRRT